MTDQNQGHAAPPFFHIGSIPIYGDLVLAPMDGISDSPFRQVARRNGSALSYTEFINAVDIEQKNPFLSKRIQFQDMERPIAFQILDNNPERIEKSARFLLDFHPDIIDINLGCCAKTVTSRGAGASLLRDPKAIANIFSRLRHLEIPVTAKIRLGWDESSLNYLEIVRILEDNNCKLIAVHGRSRQQFYGGNANWDAIASIKQAVSIPVIGNGDVKTLEDIWRMKEHTKVDAIMIGRAAIGNPWIFSGVDAKSLEASALLLVILDHLDRMLDFYGDPFGLVLFRKHLNAYIQPLPVPRYARTELLKCLDSGIFKNTLKELFSSINQPPIK